MGKPGKELSVAIVGRPNVGKSTLFNRLVGKRLALVDDTPGVTRDRREGKARLGALEFTAIDTAGLEESAPDSLTGRMRAQTERAVRDCDVTLLVVDARAGIVALDRHFAAVLRKFGKPVILVANKTEAKGVAAAALGEAWDLGLGEAVAISAEHGEGMVELHDAIAAHLPEPVADDAVAGDDEAAKGPLKLAIVGRPNVGKSTLVNALLGEERMLTGPEAGITRDAISIDWVHKGRPVRLVDTAGLRRRAKVEEKLEKLSGADTLRTIRFAEVVVLVLDAEQMLEKQDLAIARLVIEEGRALVLAVNKWDLIEDTATAMKVLNRRVEIGLPQVKGIKVVTMSAITRQRLGALMDAVVATHGYWNRRVSTPRLNRWLQAMIQQHSPPLVGGRRIKPRYLAQTGTRPPTFTLFCSKAADLPEDYRRYLINGIREDFDLPATPIRLYLRQGDNPFHDKDARP
ncbi:MAG: ribosome biogenesis GTPase Der [Rhodospirillales bacterium]|nr:ribosome biogenesis GTPase Der [Rhodospirillales bacterium]